MQPSIDTERAIYLKWSIRAFCIGLLCSNEYDNDFKLMQSINEKISSETWYTGKLDGSIWNNKRIMKRYAKR